MVNIDALERYTLDHQQQLLDEAARWRLINSGSDPRSRPKAPAPSLRRRVATMLRHTADRLEPVAAEPRLGVLRAVAHREISVDQGLRLLEANGEVR